MQLAQQNREIRLTQISLVVTLVATALLVCSTGTVALNALAEGQIGRLLEAILFGALLVLVYGNLCCQMARIGQLKRTNAHRVSQEASTRSFDVTKAPPLTILVPSYKEEISVIRQTLFVRGITRLSTQTGRPPPGRSSRPENRSRTDNTLGQSLAPVRVADLAQRTGSPHHEGTDRLSGPPFCRHRHGG